MDERNWCVYIHKCPNKKMYVGITKQNPLKRWSNGNGYKNQVFYNAIQKFGWNNIEHKVLFNNLLEEEAISKEKFLIKYYHTCLDDYNCMGYNCSYGGESSVGFKQSDFTKEKLRTNRKDSLKVICENIVYDSVTLCADKYGIKHSTMHSWLNGDAVMPLFWENKGLKYYCKELQNRTLYDNNRLKNKQIICDGILYESLSLFCIENNISDSTVSNWLNGINYMPIEFEKRGLMYANNLDKNKNIKYESKRKEPCKRCKQIICDGVEYESITIFCKINKLNKTIVKNWLNGKSYMPTEWYEKGLRNKTDGLNQNIKCKLKKEK